MCVNEREGERGRGREGVVCEHDQKEKSIYYNICYLSHSSIDYYLIIVVTLQTL